MGKNSIKIILKFIFAFGILYWLTNSGKLDFNILKKLIDRPWLVLITIILMFINILIITWRWKYILDFKSQKPFSFLKIAKYNWIGIFFNAVLPGAVTGDIIKVFYLKDNSNNLSKRFLLASVFIDRIIGLFGLILCLGFFSFINYQELTSYSQDLKTLLNMNLILFCGVIFGFITLFFFYEAPKKLAQKLVTIKIATKVVDPLIKLWDELYALKSRLIILTLTSVIVQGFAVFTFWYLCSPFSVIPFKLEYAFSLVPIGFVAIAIPIAPNGLGVGHAIFHELFSYVNIPNGASLFNIYFFVLLFTNLTGIVPYLLNKPVKMKELEEFEKSDFN